MEKKNLKGYILVFISGCLWGSIGLFVRLMSDAGSTAALTSFLRMCLAIPVLFVIALLTGGITSLRISRKTLVGCLLNGLISQALYNVSYSMAIDELGVSFSSVLLYLAPALTLVFSAMFFRERISLQKLIAIVLNIAGCALTVTGGNFTDITLSLKGLMYALLAALFYSLLPIFSRISMDEKASPYAINMYTFSFATLFILILNRPFADVTLNGSILLYGFLYALIPTTITYIIYFAGLRNVRELGSVPVICSIETVVATLIGILIFGEKVGIANFAGIFIVLLSILFMNISFRKKDGTPAAENVDV